MPPTTIEENKMIGDLVRQELPNYASRRLQKIAAAAGVLLVGQILGKVKIGALTQAFVGTGNGTLTGLAAKNLTVPGDYVLTCVAASTDAATFSVVTPSGERLKDATLGVAYSSDHLAFQLNDGSVDFTVGAKFTITVAPGSGDFKPAVVGAVDGSQTPEAILLQEVDASVNAVEDVLVLDREAQVVVSELVYHASADNADKKAAQRAFLEEKGIQFISAA